MRYSHELYCGSYQFKNSTPLILQLLDMTREYHCTSVTMQLNELHDHAYTVAHVVRLTANSDKSCPIMTSKGKKFICFTAIQLHREKRLETSFTHAQLHLLKQLSLRVLHINQRTNNIQAICMVAHQVPLPYNSCAVSLLLQSFSYGCFIVWQACVHGMDSIEQ